MKQEIWVTLQVGEQTIHRNYIIGGDSDLQSVADIDWNEQIPDMADSINQSLALDGKVF